MSRRYTMRSKEEKLEIVKQVLAGTPERAWESQGINRRQYTIGRNYILKKVKLA